MENYVPSDFTWALALCDAIPVILFSISATIIALRFKNPIFSSGAALCVLAGLGKVLWKVIIVVADKNIPFFFYEFRVTMPLGFLLLLVSFFLVKREIVWSDVKTRLSDFPAVLFYGIAVVALIALIILRFILDLTALKANWLAQIVNIIAQAGILLGILTMKPRKFSDFAELEKSQTNEAE